VGDGIVVRIGDINSVIVQIQTIVGYGAVVGGASKGDPILIVRVCSVTVYYIII